MRALERVHLTDAMHRRVRAYSKGMRQRTKLAQAIAHTPRFLVVDEPLTGLDPIARGQTLALFRDLAHEGMHILISSHVLHEVESLTQEVLLLHRGRLLAQGTLVEIRSLLNRHPRKVEIQARDGRRLARALLGSPSVGAVRISPEGDRLSLETFDLEHFFDELRTIAASERAGIQRLETTDAGLEAVFDYLVG